MAGADLRCFVCAGHACRERSFAASVFSNPRDFCAHPVVLRLGRQAYCGCGLKINRIRFPRSLNLHWYALQSSCMNSRCRRWMPSNSKFSPALAHSHACFCHPLALVVMNFILKNRPEIAHCQREITDIKLNGSSSRVAKYLAVNLFWVTG